MLSSERLPNWPPASGDHIGEERAREYIAWIRQHAQPLVEEGRRILCERFETETTGTSSARVDQLAEWMLDEGMSGLNIGTVYCAIQAGSWAQMNINIRRDGRLEVVPGWNMH